MTSPIPIDLVEAEVRAARCPVSPALLAEKLDCHWQTIYNKLEGLHSQRIVIRDEYDEEGYRLTQPHWRYILDPM